jgi:hypothetical protein
VITNEEFMEMLKLDFRSLEQLLSIRSAAMNDLRGRHFKALKKVLLMELLLTMDLPSARIVLSEANVLWLLRNVQINNPHHPDLERVTRLLKEFAKDEDAS